MWDYILFDLDGTLTDPKEGITNSVAYALKAFGIQVADKDTLCPFIGPPLKDSFRQFYGFSETQAEQAVAKYREYFAPKGIFENRPYAGIAELLARLQAQGRKCILATSKPAVFARQILEYFELNKFIDFVSGSELDGGRVQKEDVINHACLCCGINDRSRVLMVGDREYDIRGARACHIASCGVLWGYGSEAELTGAGADHLVRTVAELETLLLDETAVH